MRGYMPRERKANKFVHGFVQSGALGLRSCVFRTSLAGQMAWIQRVGVFKSPLPHHTFPK